MKAIHLHTYQRDIKQRLAKEWEQHRSVMIQMPTGTGKTHVLAAVVKEFLKETSDSRTEESLENLRKNKPKGIGKPERKVWIIAHRRELVTQAEETIGKYGIRCDDGRVRVMSVQWLTRHWEDAGRTPGLIIIDEAHHAQARTYRTLWEKCPQAKFLGLTATPCRMNGSGFTDLFDTLITSWSIAEFIKRGYLSVFDYVAIRANSEEQHLIDSLEKRGADGDYQMKEMDKVLNRDTSIERLYRSVKQFADGKKGIVYAVSIEHARRIAAWYSSRGINAVPIDSRTPAMERKRLVEDFKTGKIQVMVNVDIFSEGFDCPDVEFVQMARPTLSLAKYLQQVGRGLRKAEGKKACVLIDNVGLFRVFGLPTVAWEWEKMFRGLAIAGRKTAAQLRRKEGTEWVLPHEAVIVDCGMEVIVSHEQLLDDMKRLEMSVATPERNVGGLKAWMDKESGLWGLRRGRERVTEARFADLFDVRYGLAAVRLEDKMCGLVDEAGTVVWKKGGCEAMKFMKGRLLYVVENKKKVYYVDLYNFRMYVAKPEVKEYGNISLLKIGNTYYSRTKKVYASRQGMERSFINKEKFYLTVYDHRVPFPSYDKECLSLAYYSGFACLVEGNHDSYYWLYRKLRDGSIVVTDTEGKCYHVTDGGGTRYIGCRDSAEECEMCRTESERIAGRIEELMRSSDAEKAKRRLRLLEKPDEAHPFRSGMKWGLKVGERITVPPIYRSMRLPVGKYCAVEKNYGQWGVVALNGTLMIEPKYADIEINPQGIVIGTKVTGRKERMKLP
ncbi:DEAD/DEAH box helicase [Phocaeicola sp.]|uniref:DEAD/DEAH box helicase n=1 Tax=Phocaeicola sp. TaxID=2773926 RepID=UPI0026049E4D|nr:DEAD/DEAH box helicase [Phocaeicola sp.]